MILTKEAQEALISNYVKSGKNQDECIGFIEGVEAMNKLIGDRSKIEQAAPELLEALRIMTSLCRIKYGNLDKDVYDEILKAEETIEKATK